MMIPIDATQRRLSVWILLATLLTWSLVIADLARGGRTERMAHRHAGYAGYARYRRAADVPAGRASWDILGPTLVEVAFFGDELLDPIGVPGIWFPFGTGVSRTQYIYAVLIPLLAFLIVRSLGDQEGRGSGGPLPRGTYFS